MSGELYFHTQDDPMEYDQVASTTDFQQEIVPAKRRFMKPRSKNGVRLPSVFQYSGLFGSSSINNSVASGIRDLDMSHEKIISQIQHCELPATGSSKHCISISVPPSPTLKNMEETTSVVFSKLEGEINFNKSTILSSGGSSNSKIQMPKQVKFYSQQVLCLHVPGIHCIKDFHPA